MRLRDLVTNSKDQDIKDWFFKNTDALDVEVKNGEAYLHTLTTFVFLEPHVEEIPYPIHSLMYSKKYVSSFVLKPNSQLKSLKNLPKISREIDLSGSKHITSLRGMDIIETESLTLSYMNITDVNEIFSHLPCDLDKLDFGSENLTSLVGLKCERKIDTITLVNANIKEGGLGLLTIPGIELIMINVPVINPKCLAPLEIIEKYAGRPDDIFECQAELIDEGYEENAII